MAEAWKVKAIREAEGLTLAEFSIITGIRLDTLVRVELGASNQLGPRALAHITASPRFTKYSVWLATGISQSANGQILPLELH